VAGGDWRSRKKKKKKKKMQPMRERGGQRGWEENGG